MAQFEPKPVHVPARASAAADRNAGDARAAADQFELDRALIQFHFTAPGRPAVGRWRAIGVLSAAALATGGAIAGIAYFTGIVAATIAATAVAALIGFGNWILNHSIEL